MNVDDYSMTTADLRASAQQLVHEVTSLNAALRLLDESYHLAGIEFSLVIDGMLLHARRLASFLLSEPRDGELGAHFFFDGDGSWRYEPADCPYLGARQEQLEQSVALLGREPFEMDAHGWNFTALSNELANKWDRFLAQLPPDRLALFLAPGSPQPLRLYRVRGKLFYAGSPPRLMRR